MAGNGLRSVMPIGFLADRKSTRLNSSHVSNSYAVFCLKKKNAVGNPFFTVTDANTGALNEPVVAIAQHLTLPAGVSILSILGSPPSVDKLGSVPSQCNP